MKRLTIVAAAAVALLVGAFAGSGAAFAFNGNGAPTVVAPLTCGANNGSLGSTPEYDHCWNMILLSHGDTTGTVTNYATGAHPDIDVHLELAEGALGTGAAAAAPPDTGFFSEATTTYSGITNTPLGTPQLGVQAGLIGFVIQTNVLAALNGPACITGSGGTTSCNNIAATGQPPQCGAAGTARVTAADFPIFAASLDATNQNSTTPIDTSTQEDDTKGGAPFGVTKFPDWLATLETSGTIPASVLTGRAYGVAQVLTSATSVNFLTISPGGGQYKTITVLGNPLATFNANSQGIATCPPFESTVQSYGTTYAAPWNCTLNVFSLPVAGGCAGSLTDPGGENIYTNVAGNGFYKIALAGASDLDNDIAGNGNHLWNTWDNCKVTQNAGQADAMANGIGDACRAGDPNWANNTAGAVANAGLSCTAEDNAAAGHPQGPAQTAEVNPPFAACQDADLDGALNSSDNCPLAANVAQAVGQVNITAGDNQLDQQREGLGDACAPNYIGAHPGGKVPARDNGLGYASGAGLGYHDWVDFCNVTFNIPANGSANTCGWGLAVNGGVFHDSNTNGFPDFLNPQASTFDGPCLQDHHQDSNNDGYTDADQGTPFNTPATKGSPGLACSPQVFPTNSTVVGAVVGTDPTLGCAGRDLLGSAAQQTAAKKAKADVNLSGGVNILDLSVAASKFGQSASITDNTDSIWELDQNGDSHMNILDLSIQASFFGQAVPAC